MAGKPGLFARTRKVTRALRRDRSGLALIEFAFSLPIFIGLGFYGVEVANLAVTQMKMSQIALNMADNASRIGTLNSNLAAKVINEQQINDVFQAASIQAGAAGLYDDGRTVLSSLEVNASGGQTIMWQRCKGMAIEDSEYGPQGTGATGTGFAGMGPPGDKISASVGTAVMYVELTYTYEPLFGTMFMEPQELRQEAAYTVRDAREIGKEPTNNVVAARQSTCNKYDAILPQTSDADIAAAQAALAAAQSDDDDDDDDDDEDMPGYSGGNNPNNPGKGLCVAQLVCVKI
ncbi:TadE/TadG family type IV pilus assembly protein [Sphingomonas sp. 35-24ZXX]|uniref:TadE/TadG family type IV pilus assembly protein n=1 Tax=Sphingomonas sp. 35-24ZXX TaxID=1545915 RepID=UPI000AE10155|nr:TadE/TadG family type IV pilus assembly protein [Sphingomonas sp. 35-24ZXX]